MSVQPSRAYQCNVCDKAYSRKEHLSRHHSSKHQLGHAFTCNVCQRKFNRSDILKRHTRIHIKDDVPTRKRKRNEPQPTEPILSAAEAAVLSSSECAVCSSGASFCLKHFSLSQLDHSSSAAWEADPQQYPSTMGLPSSAMAAGLGDQTALAWGSCTSPLSSKYSNASDIAPLPLVLSPADEALQHVAENPLLTRQVDPWTDFGLQAGMLTPSYDMIYTPSLQKPTWEQLYLKLTSLEQPSPNTPSTPTVSELPGMTTLHYTPDKSSGLSGSNLLSLVVPFAARTPSVSSNPGHRSLLNMHTNDVEEWEADNAWTLQTTEVQRCCYDLCQPPHFTSMLSQEDIASWPSTNEFNRFIKAFFERFDTVYSFLHKGSFNAHRCPWGLLLCIAMSGARYDEDPLQYADQSSTLYKAAKKTLDYAVQQDFSVVRELWWQQANHLLIMADLTELSSDRFDAGQIAERSAILVCQRQGWLANETIDRDFEASLPLRERWLRWVTREEKKRLGLSIFAVEAISSLIWGSSTSDLWNDVAMTTLPGDVDLWQAPDEQAWAALAGPTALLQRTRFDQLFRRTCAGPRQPESLPELKNHFTLLILVWFTSVFAAKAQSTILISQSLFAKGSGETRPLMGGLSEDNFKQLQNCRECLEQIANTRVGTFAGTVVARYAALTGTIEHLPAPFLQSYARQSQQSTELLFPTVLKDWIESDNGKRARESVYYASQIYRLFGAQNGDPDSLNRSNIMNCFSLFYAALVLAFYCRFHNEHVPTAREPEIVLNYCRTRRDPLISKWIEEDIGLPSLDGVGYVHHSSGRDRCQSASRVLQVFGKVLLNNVNVKLSAQLHAVVTHLQATCDRDAQAL